MTTYGTIYISILNFTHLDEDKWAFGNKLELRLKSTKTLTLLPLGMEIYKMLVEQS